MAYAQCSLAILLHRVELGLRPFPTLNQLGPDSFGPARRLHIARPHRRRIPYYGLEGH